MTLVSTSFVIYSKQNPYLYISIVNHKLLFYLELTSVSSRKLKMCQYPLGKSDRLAVKGVYIYPTYTQ